MPANFIGNIDVIEKSRIAGWIKWADEENPVAVTITINDRIVCDNMLASNFRSDLADAGIGNGCHGFDVEFEGGELEYDAVPIDIVVAAVGHNGVRLAKRVEVGELVDVVRANGNIESIADRTVSGWIKKRGSIKPVRIDILVDEMVVARNIPADNFRKDVHDAGFGSGHYGFSVPILAAPSVLTDDVQVHVRETDTSNNLLSASFTSHQFRDDFLVILDNIDDDYIFGWSVNKNVQSASYFIKVLIDGTYYCEVRNDLVRRDVQAAGYGDGRGGFSFGNPAKYLPAGEYRLDFEFPDGSRSEPYTLSAQRPHLPPRPLTSRNVPAVTIIVPVYNAADDFRICLANLRIYTPATARIILVDDKSTDPLISYLMSSVSDDPRFTILRNDTNMGFTKTVNRGISEAGQDDVVLLNSDARVTPGWLEGLLTAAATSSKVATVTAMSDRAGAFSAPDIGNGNDLPASISESDFARAFRARSLGLYPEVPTGNGFCMFIRRACLDDIGLFDEIAFPRGYGEENDFCMRAWRRGWTHLIDDRTYVFHERSKSFGASKDDLMAQGRQVIERRYPEYRRAIRVFSEGERILAARYQARLALEDCLNLRSRGPRVLYVVSTSSGGTPQTNKDLMMALSGTLDCWLLQCNGREVRLSQLGGQKFKLVQQTKLQTSIEPLVHTSEEYDALVRDWILRYGFDLIHIRHIGWHSLSLPAIAKSLNRKVVFSFHDFYTISPLLKLIDDRGDYLGESYTSGGSIFRESIWKDNELPELTAPWIDFWRARFDTTLSKCDYFITTSPSAKELVTRRLPSVSSERFEVIPHGRDFLKFDNGLSMPRRGEPVKILLPGNINVAKGLAIICELARIDTLRQLEFHILGTIDEDAFNILSKGEVFSNIIVHGQYSRDHFADKVSMIRPHIGGIFSIWDETYCHTLTEMWSAGFPAVVFDFPTVAGRVKETGAGWVVPHNDLNELLAQILLIARDMSARRAAHEAVIAWQENSGSSGTVGMMAMRYLDVYRRVLAKENSSFPPAKCIAVVCPSEPNLVKGNASTHIRVWERTVTNFADEYTYVRMRPGNALAAIECGMVAGVIVQRNAIPAGIAKAFLSAIDQKSVPMVLDIDDDLLNVPADKDPSGVYRAYSETLQMLLRRATAVTVSTETLRRRYMAYSSNVVTLENALSPRLWLNKLGDRGCDGHVRALYMGTVTHDQDLEVILPALDAVARNHTNFRVSVIGVTASETMFVGRDHWLERIKIPSDTVSYDAFVPWLFRNSDSFDFALAPLADTEFNHTKSSLKLLDYAALGLPVLASDVPTYLSDAPAVYRVKNVIADWTRAIEQRIQAGGENRSLGLRQLQWVRSKHFLTDAKWGFGDLFKQLFQEQDVKAREREKT